MATAHAIDPGTLEVVQAFLTNMVREMRANLASSGWNVALVETHDFSCGLISNKAELLAMSEDIPNHVFAIAYHTQLAMDTYGEALYPGDVLLTNDPYTGGPHLSDMLMIHPYFVDGKLTILIAIRAHWTDMGGKNPGSLAGQSREIYEEGIRVPLVKIVNRGEVNDDLLQTILANVRNSDDAYGDFLAMMGTCKQAETRLDELFARYPHDILETCIEVILARSERLVRNAVSTLPDGDYYYEEYMESDGYTSDPMRVQCKLTIAGDRLTFDFSGSAAQVRGPMNAGPACAYSGTFVMVKSFLEPETPVNGGAMRPIQVKTPVGTILSARLPAPVAGFAEVVYIVEHVVLGLLAQVLPEKVGSMPEVGANHTYITGWDELRGRHWIFYEYPRGGTAASPRVDGSNAVCQYDLGDITCNVPVERCELEYPLTVECHLLRQDSGGPGYRRGGLGSRREIKVLAPEGCRLSLVGEGAIIPRLGVSGGYPGALNVFTVVRDDNEFFPGDLPSKTGNFPLQKGDVLVIQARGGSGWGDPLTREVERVQADVADGYVSRQQARDAYGVVFNNDDVDLAATNELRVRLSSERIHISVVPVESDEYDEVGRRLCRIGADMAARLGVSDGDVIDYVPSGLGPHLKAWIRIDPSLTDDTSPLGSNGRSILRVKGSDPVWVKPLRPPV